MFSAGTIYIEIKFDFNLERDKITQFLQKMGLNWDQNGTKIKGPNWEIANDISDTCHYHYHITLSLPRGTMTAWHVIFFFYFLKKIQKIKIKK